MQHNASSSRARSGKIIAGIVLLAVGVVLLLEQLGLSFPDWLVSWPMLLIIFGLLTGVKSGFKHPGWVILLAAGGIFLLDRLYPHVGILRFVGPFAVIGLGLLLLFGKHRPWKHPTWYTENPPEMTPAATAGAVDGTEFVDAVSVFGGVKKSILSKHFVGGDIVAFMGGIELNLSQADIQGRVKLEVTQVLGGTKLIVPPHWDVVSEMTAVFGGIEDKRIQQPGMINREKVLVIEGTTVLGGIEINSYA